MKYVLGIDLGTSATKTILVDENGVTRASAEYSYPMYQPHNGWAEQDPADWKKAVLATIKEVVQKTKVKPEEVTGIGLSGQMHGSVLLDENNEPLGRTILWCDQRSSRQVDEMLELLPMEKWLEISANPPLAAWTAAKMLWIRENEPEKYAKCRHLLLPKDYIRFVLTGEFATDVSDATGMQMLDVQNRCWSDEILDALKIDKSILGKLYESQEVTGYLLPEIAEECGLSTKTAVVAGGSDNACAAVGTGVVNEGQAFVTLGTSAVVYSHFDHYIRVPEGGLHVCCCAVPGCWHSMGGPMSAGLSIEWFKDRFCQDLVQKAKEENRSFYDMLTEITDAVPIGSERLIYLPFLMGERTPHMDPLYRGAFLGLNTVHSQAHMLRAIMEGVVYCLADCNNMLKEQGIQVTSMRACGGGSRSIVYRKMLADLFECDIHTLGEEGGAAYGAAILAGVGTGLYPSVREACSRFITEKDTVSCDPKDAELYKKYHRIYDHMYEALKSDFAELAKL
ncbi:MAG TPA: xylulokinase [Candidatus Merdisoma merdipullorum]|nr:xylulokinase [Candidatus Merdisoma merdipullorum]